EYFDYVRPGGAFYVMARYRFSDRSSREVAEEMIRQAQVITIPGGSYGPGGEGHLRISFGADLPSIDAAFDRIGRWVRGM
ncbi:MAG TPA: aminotransferase, partial [Desulfomicrobiaceae bacterium]|nr:aminotransferase [Desulfomicrobiaceae bacterium]